MVVAAHPEPMNLASGPRTTALIKENRSPAEVRHAPHPASNTREKTTRPAWSMKAPGPLPLGEARR